MMINSDRFANFLNKHTRKSIDDKIIEAKDEFLKNLDLLYKNIDKWLKPYLDSKKIEFVLKDIEINEEFAGTYSTKMGTILIADIKIAVVPIGALILGARGRVDLIGPLGKTTLLVVDKDSNEPNIVVRTWIHGQEPPPIPEPKPFVASWKIATPGPNRKFIELNAETFLNSIIDISDM